MDRWEKTIWTGMIAALFIVMGCLIISPLKHGSAWGWLDIGVGVMYIVLAIMSAVIAYHRW